MDDPNEWLASQPDLVGCQAGGKITLRACKLRQERKGHWETDESRETRPAFTFVKCVGCEHFKPKPPRQGKLKRKDLLDVLFPQRIENRRKREGKK